MKILLVNTKFLGDLVVSTPGLRSLKEADKEAEIVLLARKGYESTLRNNPNISRIIGFDYGLKRKNLFGRIRDELEFIKMIRKEKFDAVISLHPGDRIAFLAWLSGAAIRIAPRKQSFHYLFTNLVDVEEDSIPYLEYYAKIISEYTKSRVELKTEFFTSSGNDLWASDFLKSFGCKESDLIIGIHPGASEPTKIWPLENYAGLIDELESLPGCKVLLIQGPKEEKIVSGIKKLLRNKDVLIYSSEDVNKTASLIKKCRLFISNDTGTRHLSVALQIPVIALIPDDNKKCWDFYGEADNHHIIWGKRFIPEAGSDAEPFLDSINIQTVLGKIKDITAL